MSCQLERCGDDQFDHLGMNLFWGGRGFVSVVMTLVFLIFEALAFCAWERMRLAGPSRAHTQGRAILANWSLPWRILIGFFDISGGISDRVEELDNCFLFPGGERCSIIIGSRFVRGCNNGTDF